MAVYDKLMVTRFIADQTAVGVNLYRIVASTPLVAALAYMSEAPELPDDSVFVGLCLGCSSLFAFGIGAIMFTLNKEVAATTMQVANMSFKFLSILVSLVVWPHCISISGWAAIFLSCAGFYLYSNAHVRVMTPEGSDTGMTQVPERKARPGSE